MLIYTVLWFGCCQSFWLSSLISAITIVWHRENDITHVLDETFSQTEDRFGQLVTIELKPGGENVAVTEENKKEYVDTVVSYRISKRVKAQFDTFMEGLLELIPRDLINVFDERELELLIGGMSEIDMFVTLSISSKLSIDIRPTGMTGRNSRTTAVTKKPTKSLNGFGSVSVLGLRNASPVFFSSQRELRVCR